MIHYLHGLVKLFAVNLQSTVSGIIKVLKKSMEGHCISDLLACRGAGWNATQFGDGSPRGRGVSRGNWNPGCPWGHFLPCLSFWIFWHGLVFLLTHPSFQYQKPLLHVHLEKMRKRWLLPWVTSAVCVQTIDIGGHEKVERWSTRAVSIRDPPTHVITCSGWDTHWVFRFKNPHGRWCEVGGRGRWIFGLWGLLRIQGCYFHIKM